MIKINDRFSIERQDDCWIVTEFRQGVSRKEETKGETITSERKRHFPCLHHVVEFILEKTPEGAKSLQEVVTRMEILKSEIYRRIMGGNHVS
jgi:hypothetical protein